VVEELLEALDTARADFVDALGDIDAALVTAPGVMGDWSVRDLVIHVAWWCAHASDALDLVGAGRGSEFAYSTRETDAMNARILGEARRASPSDALGREEAAFTAFRTRVAALETAQLSLRLGNGDTVEEVIRYDGPDHYAEHTAHLRAWFGADDEPDPDG
jgi:Mycothiol maleylpyruvate isomerase N-terminal domain